MFEILFCPVHGLFRPDNIVPLWNLLQVGAAHFSYLLRRIGLL